MSSKPRKTGNLVALGSAAVVAVYGAGFMRTAAAAQRFAEQSDERVLSPEDAVAAKAQMKSATILSDSNDSNSVSPKARQAVAPTKSAQTGAVNKADATIAKIDSKKQIASARSATRNVTVPETTTTIATATGAPAANAKPVTEKQSLPVAVMATSAPVIPAAIVAPTPVVRRLVAPTPVVPTLVVPTPVVPTFVVPTPIAPAAAPVAPTPTEASIANAAPAKLKDGEYTGYGTSRHGDVEVYLETTDGKITYVKISQCLTQYSCSWISDLPKQVLARQSARVDGVSGATQSANAFYYAVVQALAKAK